MCFVFDDSGGGGRTGHCGRHGHDGRGDRGGEHLFDRDGGGDGSHGCGRDDGCDGFGHGGSFGGGGSGVRLLVGVGGVGREDHGGGERALLDEGGPPQAGVPGDELAGADHDGAELGRHALAAPGRGDGIRESGIPGRGLGDAPRGVDAVRLLPDAGRAADAVPLHVVEVEADDRGVGDGLADVDGPGLYHEAADVRAALLVERDEPRREGALFEVREDVTAFDVHGVGHGQSSLVGVMAGVGTAVRWAMSPRMERPTGDTSSRERRACMAFIHRLARP